MALADETDPVETVRLILDETTDTDWEATGAKPSFIEHTQETSRSTKTNRDHGPEADAVYVESPSDGDIRQLGEGRADGRPASYEDVQVVSAEVWTPVDGNRATSLASDVRDILLDYWTDNFQNTAWQAIRPVSESDLRGENHPLGGNSHFVIATTVRLRADRDG